MEYKNTFVKKCSMLSDYLKELNSRLDKIKENLIIDDFNRYFNKNGKDITLSTKCNLVNCNGIEEIIINGEVFNINNRSKGKYLGFVVNLELEFCTIGLGFMYKNKVISPHMDFCVDDILNKYNKEEIEEIITIIDEKINCIKSDIKFIDNHKDNDFYKHYYGVYNKGFESKLKFNSIDDVVNYFNEEDASNE